MEDPVRVEGYQKGWTQDGLITRYRKWGISLLSFQILQMSAASNLFHLLRLLPLHVVRTGVDEFEPLLE